MTGCNNEILYSPAVGHSSVHDTR